MINLSSIFSLAAPIVGALLSPEDQYSPIKSENPYMELAGQAIKLIDEVRNDISESNSQPQQASYIKPPAVQQRLPQPMPPQQMIKPINYTPYSLVHSRQYAWDINNVNG